uniref:TTF-type domain-containing protein n=1 Tax=Fagus sylvatica TaxID=28930 RepID=A0A2N9H6F6_FAGSY
MVLRNRRFNKGWFTQFDWLEYSIAKDAAFCLYCYLFKRDVGEQAGGDTFVTEGFSNWKCPEKLRIHEGGINSSHNQARRMFEDLLKPNQSIQSFHFKQTDQARIEYRTRLNASIDCIRFLLRQGLAFRDHNEDIKAVTLRNAPENNMMISPAIQKDIVSAAAVETSNAIIMELGDAFFSVLIDESRDISTKEQMAVALRYVDKKGHVVERFLGIEHVTDTTALSLKAAVEDLFCRHGLSLSRLRGQGYDGASNMQVATATVERAFSVMKIVKNRLRSRISDQWMNDSLIVYIEKDIFHSIDNEVIMQRFQNMKTHRNQL